MLPNREKKQLTEHHQSFWLKDQNLTTTSITELFQLEKNTPFSKGAASFEGCDAKAYPSI
jgi:hypothetical protein